MHRNHHNVGQAQLLSTPGRKTSPKVSKAKVDPLTDICRSVTRDAAFDYPATPDHCSTNPIVQPELRLTPPSMQSPDIYARHHHKNASRRENGLPRLCEAVDNLKSPLPPSAQRCKREDAGTEPVRVPTTAKDKDHTGPRGLVSENPTLYEARDLTKSCVYAVPEVACDSHDGLTAVCCLHTPFFAFNHSWR